MQKILILGVGGLDYSSEKLKVSSFWWKDFAKIENVSDHHIVLIFCPKSTESLIEAELFKKLNPHVLINVISNQGKIYIIGDPRGKMRDGSPFLEWMGLRFRWGLESGDTKAFDSVNKENNKEIQRYYAEIRKWSYSFESVSINPNSIGPGQGTISTAVGPGATVSKRSHVSNRYQKPIVFDVVLGGEKLCQPIRFLPPIDLSHDDVAMIVLADMENIQLREPEPAWLAAICAPGQKSVDLEIERLSAQLNQVQAELSIKELEKSRIRHRLKLLYAKGSDLERQVLETFKSLGATVEESTDPSKEDGWISVTVGGTECHGVLEIKSTRKSSFSEEGIKQLPEWRMRGIDLKNRKCKGIFVGSHDVSSPISARRNPYSDSWINKAELFNVVGLGAVDLYRAYEADQEGRLNKQLFWKTLFETDGPANIDQCFHQNEVFVSENLPSHLTVSIEAV